MTYEELIPRLDYELRDAEAWPADSSKIDEQINLLYVSALAVAREVSLNRLNLEESDVISGNVVDGSIRSYPLPDDIFDLRWPPQENEQRVLPGDMGISKLRLDGKDFLISQGMPIQSLFEVANRLIHKARYLFSLDFPGNQIYATNVDTFKLYHVRKPTRPTNNDPDDANDYKSLEWPLQNDSDTQRAVHIVATHVSGSTIKDPAGSQFQSLLNQVYNL